MPPCVIFEDEHLLVVNKPAGMNTHAPGPHAGEGIYEWLKNREPRRANLAIIHRLDKETSGVMVFGKTPAANRSLTEQFTHHTVEKIYHLITDRPVKAGQHKVVSSLVRVGEKYASRPLHAGGERAETLFKILRKVENGTLLEARPVTGRTHQIRAQSAAEGFPVLGDVLYGGTAWSRVCLHAAQISFKHPVIDKPMVFQAPEQFKADARPALREALIEKESTDAWRLIHGAADGWPGWYVEKWGQYLLSQSEQDLSKEQLERLRQSMEACEARGAYHKILTRHVRRSAVPQVSPRHVLGETAPATFVICENGLKFEASFNEGYSVGLFLDQRDNRRRLLVNYVASEFALLAGGMAGAEVLNTFSYTCGFSVCAAKAGARTTSLDLSKKYLEWGKRNFSLNDIDPAQHDFIFGDAFDWLRRFAKKGRMFDVVLLDPPTFSQSKQEGVFQAERDYGKLVKSALPLIKPGGVLFASANAAKLEPEKFLSVLGDTAKSSGQKIVQEHYVPQPPDFPVNRQEPAYLKTVWVRLR